MRKPQTAVLTSPSSTIPAVEACRAVRRSERVVHVDVAVARQRLHEIGILLFLALMEAQVFEQDALALLARRDFLFRVLAHDVGREGHLSAQELAQTSGRRAPN